MKLCSVHQRTSVVDGAHGQTKAQVYDLLATELRDKAAEKVGGLVINAGGCHLLKLLGHLLLGQDLLLLLLLVSHRARLFLCWFLVLGVLVCVGVRQKRCKRCESVSEGLLLFCAGKQAQSDTSLACARVAHKLPACAHFVVAICRPTGFRYFYVLWKQTPQTKQRKKGRGDG